MIIYKTTNLINTKIYIGQDSNNDSKYLGSGLLLTRAIKKYGKDNFRKEILENCISKKDLDEKEKYWIKYYDSTNDKIGYNISEGGTGGKLVEVEGKKGKTYEEYYGVEKAKELKELFSKLRKGKKKPFVNITPEEAGKKISDTLLNKHMIRSESTKSQIGKTLKIYYETPEGKLKKEEISKFQSSKKQTNESNNKRHKSMKGRRPKVMEVHPSARYWFFYNKTNNLILETLGNKKEAMKKLEVTWRRIICFTNLTECLNYKLNDNKKYKVFTKKYYEK